MTTLDPALLEQLRQFDTPTICNGLEEVAGRRTASGFTTEPLVAADPTLPPIVGYARTATIRAVAPSAQPAASQSDLRLAYYEYVASAPGPTIAVIQDLDHRPGVGAFWGEVQSNIHKALGLAGALTDGSFRDLDALAPDFQILGGKIGPSHAHVHLEAIDVGVNIFGMTVRPGDLIHGDHHGAVVIPAEAAPRLLEAIDTLTRREAVILEACQRPDFTLETLRQAIADSAEIH
jgi:regulator of RNase E activity RraA